MHSCYHFTVQKKHSSTKALVVSSFFVFITFFSVVQYDAGRQTEHLLLGTCIIPIFLFDGWRKNVLFLMFVIAFFAIKIINLYQHNEPIRIDTFYIIYAITFLSVYVIASYFKHDIVQFNNRLQEANKTKDKLFKIIAHDIKNPFNSLLGISELQLKYLKTDNKQKLEKSANIINESSNRIYMLTQTLLDWAIIQAEGFKVNKTKNSVRDIVSETIEICSLSAKSKNIEVIMPNEKDIIFQCDKIMTQIAIRNILLNAIKFSSRNSKVIIDFFIIRDKLEIIIKDEGVGMKNEIWESILSSSKPGSKFGTEKEEGAGIGLRMSLDLIQKQNGEILVDGQPGEGSTFKIILPY